jgi:hypothetical protein
MDSYFEMMAIMTDEGEEHSLGYLGTRITYYFFRFGFGY